MINIIRLKLILNGFIFACLFLTIFFGNSTSVYAQYTTPLGPPVPNAAPVDIGQTFRIGSTPIASIIGDLTGTSRISTLIVRLIFAVSLIAFIIVLIMGSVRYITSGGDPNSVAGARSQLLYAIIGIFIVISSYVVVKLIQEITGLAIV